MKGIVSFINSDKEEQVSNKSFRWGWISFLLACVLLFFGKYTHELWLDEWQAFGVARSSHSISSFLANVRYEGHPMLYFLLLKGLSLFSTSSLALQVFHGCAAVLALYLLHRYAPFPFFVKILLVVSYYFIWEYTLLNRVYVWCLLFLFFTAKQVAEKKLSLTAFLILFTLLCLLDGYSAMAGLFLCVVFISKNELNKKQLGALAITVIVNMVLLYFSTKQPSDSTFTPHAITQLSRDEWIAFLRFFDFGIFTHHTYEYNQWNWCYFFPEPVLYILAVFILASLFITLRKPQVLFALLLAYLGLAYINLQISACALRHVGFYFILYLLALWLSPPKEKWRYYFVVMALCMQGYWGLRMFVLDYEHPFSLSEQAAKQLIESNPSHLPVVGYGEVSVDDLSGVLNQPVINIKSGQAAWFYHWNQAEDIPSDKNDSVFFKQLNQTFSQRGMFFLSMNSDPRIVWVKGILDSLSMHQAQAIKKMPEFLGAIVPTENFMFYRIDSTVVFP